MIINKEQFNSLPTNLQVCFRKKQDNLNGGAYSGGERSDGDWKDNSGFKNDKLDEYQQPLGRFPANLIHDNSEEVRECFPETNASKSANRGLQHSGRHGGLADIGGNIKDGTDTVRGHDDNGGNASRFFKSIIYQAKAPKNQRYSLLTCNCQTVKLESWLKQDQNQKEKTDGTSQEADTLENSVMEDLDSNTTLSGSNITDQSLKDTTSTTLTETSSTTNSLTSNSLPQQNISESTEGAKSETENGGSLAESVKNSNQSQQNTGTSQKKDGLCTGVAVSATLAESYRKSVCSNCGGEVKSSGHPTQKPIALMEYLIKMVTPKGGVVLDPFAGSGSTLVAAKQNGFQYIGIEMTEEYIPIIEARLRYSSNTLF